MERTKGDGSIKKATDFQLCSYFFLVKNWQVFYYKTKHQDFEKCFSRFEDGDDFVQLNIPVFWSFLEEKVVIKTGVREVSQYNKLFLQLEGTSLFFHKYWNKIHSLGDIVYTHCKQIAGSETSFPYAPQEQLWNFKQSFVCFQVNADSLIFSPILAVRMHC